MSTIVQKLGWWFFCKLGDPIFSPCQAMLGDVVCLWCGKQHGKLTNASAWDFMAQRFLETLTASGGTVTAAPLDAGASDEEQAHV